MFSFRYIQMPQHIQSQELRAQFASTRIMDQIHHRSQDTSVSQAGYSPSEITSVGRLGLTKPNQLGHVGSYTNIGSRKSSWLVIIQHYTSTGANVEPSALPTSALVCTPKCFRLRTYHSQTTSCSCSHTAQHSLALCFPISIDHGGYRFV